MPDAVRQLMTASLLMEKAWTLDNDAYLSMDFQPGQAEIHVLVELPAKDMIQPPRPHVNPFGFVDMCLASLPIRF